VVDNAAIHWTTTMDPLVAHRTAISRHALEIAAEIASSGLGHVTLEMVVQVLLDRYGVTDMAALRAGGVRDVPALHLLSELQRKTDAFLQAYFATRSVLAYVDAEHELVDALNAFDLPPLPSLAGDATAAAVAAVADPNEIDLDADVGAPAAPAAADAAAAAAVAVRPPLPARYEDFGLGALYLHPLVAAYFPVQQHVLASAHADCVSAEGVLAAFVSVSLYPKAGLAIANSASAMINCVLLFYGLKKAQPKFSLRQFQPAVLRMLAAAAVAAVAAYATRIGCTRWIGHATFPAKVAEVFMPIAAGTLAYGGVALATGLEEVRDVLDVLRRRRTPAKPAPGPGA
jgi:hypothetical protein